MLQSFIGPGPGALVELMWGQPLASRVVLKAVPRLSGSTRPAYTCRAALTLGDSMIVDLSALNSRPLGTGMSSKPLCTARGGVDAQPTMVSRMTAMPRYRMLDPPF